MNRLLCVSLLLISFSAGDEDLSTLQRAGATTATGHATAAAPETAAPARIDRRFFVWPRGWASTDGGRGGKILRVTSLDAAGPGTLRAAIEAEGPRIIVFETSGNIDLEGQVLHVRNPHMTLAGQTAPSPGITIIKGGIQTHTHDLIIQHLKIRPGTGAGKEADALETQKGSFNVVVDHCSLSWGTDEVLSAGGFAFDGKDIDQWRAATSNRITFSNNIIAEALTSAGQGYGTLIEDNATGILLYGNYYVHNRERSPNFGGGTQGAFINNLIYNSGGKFLDYTFARRKWDEEGGGLSINGKIAAIGNVARAGPETTAKAFFETVSNGDVHYFANDNLATRADGSIYPDAVESAFLDNPRGRIMSRRVPPVFIPRIAPMPAAAVAPYIQATVGARPWDRDAVDRRVLDDFRNGTGRFIASESEVGGYPENVVNKRKFNLVLWDLATMTPRVPHAL